MTAIKKNQRTFKIAIGFICMLFFMGFLHSQAFAKVLDVPVVTQERDNWCWAASSKAVLEYYGQDIKQCTIAEYQRTHSTYKNYGSINCCEDNSPDCNQGGTVGNILLNWGVNNIDYAFALSQSIVSTEIDNNRPFIILWEWSTGGRHFLVGHGNESGALQYMDPWYGEGQKSASYDWVVSGSNHTWIHTTLLECTSTIFPMNALFSASGNTGTVAVTTSASSCSWNAVSNAPWITITEGSAGTGNGTVAYSISANTTGSTRGGFILIGNWGFNITQRGSDVRVISPNGGETWTIGSTQAITWTASNLNPASSIYLYYWYNNNWQHIAGPLLPSQTSYSWRVPNTPTTSSYIEIRNWVDNAYFGARDQSDQQFSIQTTQSCAYTISPTSAPLSSSGNTGIVGVTTSASSCTWTAASNASWITITAGSAGTGNGTVSYSVSANTGTSARSGTMTIGGKTFTVTQNGSTPPVTNAALYFPHVATNFPWQTEIAIINPSPDYVTGTLRGFSNEGQLIETKDVPLPARGRRQIIIADEFTNHTNIGYIIFDTDSTAVQGYTKFYIAGSYRAAIPAVKEVNTSDIYIPHIASNADWWTGVSLVNTTSAPKELTITFNNGQSRQITLTANQHRAFDIAQEFFNNQPPPDIQSAVITNASGIIGLELFGSLGWGTQLEGVLLTDKTTSPIYYPHVADDEWWTGIVAYNPSASACTITITPYSAQGDPLSPSTLPIPGKGKYIGAVADLGLSAQTAWFKISAGRAKLDRCISVKAAL